MTKILIVDDDSDTLNLLDLLLVRMGHQVFQALDGKQALEKAAREQPDLVILDVMMPGMDGFEVARRLRGVPGNACLPILMFTAKSQPQDRATGYEAGATLYLTKPVQPLILRTYVARLLASRPSEPANPDGPGYLVGVTAAKGGQGVSTIALNLAIAYHNSQQVDVIAAEMKPGQGSWALELDIKDAAGLQDLLRLEPEQITGEMVARHLRRTMYGVQLLLASTASADVAYATRLSQFQMIIRHLLCRAPLVVLDIGSNFHPMYDELLQACDEIILVTEPQPVEMKRSRILVSELEALGFGSQKALTLVASRHRKIEAYLSASQAEQILGRGITVEFSGAPHQARLAAAQAHPLSQIQPDGELAHQFGILAEHLARHVQEFQEHTLPEKQGVNGLPPASQGDVYRIVEP
ncbi:MAG: response regulator [Chloroflexota bacterium]